MTGILSYCRHTWNKIRRIKHCCISMSWHRCKPPGIVPSGQSQITEMSLADTFGLREELSVASVLPVVDISDMSSSFFANHEEKKGRE